MAHDDLVIARWRRSDRPADTHSFFGVPAEKLSGVSNFADGVCEGLAGLAHDQPGEFITVLVHDFKTTPENFGFLAWSNSGPLLLRDMRRAACGLCIVG